MWERDYRIQIGSIVVINHNYLNNELRGKKGKVVSRVGYGLWEIAVVDKNILAYDEQVDYLKE